MSVTSPRRLYGDLIWVAFVSVQALDGAMTLIGIQAFGVGIEANPIVAWYAMTWGPVAGVVGAKLAAVACGAIVHRAGYDRTLAALAGLYAVGALAPWARLLSDVPM